MAASRSAARASPRAASCRRCRSRHLPTIGAPYGIIVTGVGGTGIVTIGGVLGMAAHLEGKGVGIIDMAGLAQKGGAVYSHIRIANKPEDIHAIRMAAGGCRSRARRRHRGRRQQEGAGRGQARRDADRRQHRRIPARRLHPQRRFLAADRAPEARDRDRRRPRQCRRSSMPRGLRPRCSAIRSRANIFLVGYAFQKGAMPLSAEAIEKAIEMNGEAVAMNQAAFRWGRRAALDLADGRKADRARGRQPGRQSPPVAIARRDHRAPRRFPARLSGAAYARRYRRSDRPREARPRSERPRARRR